MASSFSGGSQRACDSSDTTADSLTETDAYIADSFTAMGYDSQNFQTKGGDVGSGPPSICEETNLAPMMSYVAAVEGPGPTSIDSSLTKGKTIMENQQDPIPSVYITPQKKPIDPLWWGTSSQPAAFVGDVDGTPLKPLYYSQDTPPLPPRKICLKDAARKGERSPENSCRWAEGKGRPAERFSPDRPTFYGSPSTSSASEFTYTAATAVGGGRRVRTSKAFAYSQATFCHYLLEDEAPPVSQRRAAGAKRLYREHVSHRPLTRSMSTALQQVYVPIAHFEDSSEVVLPWPEAPYTVGELLEDYICPIWATRMVRVKIVGIIEPQVYLHQSVDVMPPRPLLPKREYENTCVCCLPEGETHLPIASGSSDSDFNSDSDPIAATAAETTCEEDRTWEMMSDVELEGVKFSEMYFRYDNLLPFEQKFHDIHWLREEKGNYGTSRNWLSDHPEVGVPNMTKEMTPLDILDRFITLPMCIRMVRQTNLYANQKQRKGWTPLTVLELKCWLGIAVFMGIKKLPRLSMYWRRDHDIFRNDFIANLMSRDRWMAIMSSLHLVDNASVVTDKEDPAYDKIVKVRWLVETLCANFRAAKPVDRFLSVDEMMIACTSRHCPIKQFNKDKPDPHGMKVWALVSATSKFIYALNVYCGAQSGPGKTGAVRPPPNQPFEQRTTYRVVMALMQHVPSEVGHVITMDNYFSSVKLFADLLERRIFATGTVRPGMVGWPSSMLWSKKMKGSRGELRWRMHASMQMGSIVWYDRKAVGILSTFAQPWSVDATVVRREGHKKVVVPTSPALLSYVKLMRGVDVADQLRGGYSISRKGRRWWKRLFFFLLDSAFCNCWVLANQMWEGTPRELLPYPTHLDFNIALGDCLVSGWRLKKESRQSEGIAGSDIPKQAHAPVWCGKSRRQCVECGRRSNWRCEVCDGAPYLCLRGEGRCYQVHHGKNRQYI